MRVHVDDGLLQMLNETFGLKLPVEQVATACRKI